MKISFFCASLFLFLLICFTPIRIRKTTAQSEGVVMGIHAKFVIENTVIKYGDSLKVKLCLSNFTQESVLLRHHVDWIFHLRMTDNAGNPVRINEKEAPETMVDEIFIQGRECLTREFLLRLEDRYNLNRGKYLIHFVFDRTIAPAFDGGDLTIPWSEEIEIDII